MHLLQLFFSSLIFIIAHAINSACPLFNNLQVEEASVYSQNGEDGVLMAILSLIGHKHKNFVEFGVEDAQQCNTRLLQERHNFSGLFMDGGYHNEKINLQQEFITVENIVKLFMKYNVPQEFDVLSIDLDMFDFWILAEILAKGQYRPRIIVVEVNPTLGVSNTRMQWQFHEVNSYPLTVPHPFTVNQSVWDRTRFSGANPSAMKLLGNHFDYEMVYCESCGVNCFLVHKSELDKIHSCSGNFPPPTVHYPCYKVGNLTTVGHHVDPLGRKPVLIMKSYLSEYLNTDLSRDRLSQLMSDHAFSVDTLSTESDLRSRKFAEKSVKAAATIHTRPFHCTQSPFKDIDFVNEDYSSKALYDLSLCDCVCSTKGCEDPWQLDDIVAQFQAAYLAYTHHSNSFATSDAGYAQYSLYCNVVKHAAWNDDILYQMGRSDHWWPAETFRFNLCGAIASMHVKRVLHMLAHKALDKALNTTLQGLKYSPTNHVLSIIAQHFTVAKELKYSMRNFATSQQISIQSDSRRFIVLFGLSICEDSLIAAKQQWHLDRPGLDLLHINLHTALRDSVFWGLTHDAFPRFVGSDLDGHSKHDPDMIFSFVPECLRGIYHEREVEVQAMCIQRSQATTVLVVGPLFSGVSQLHQALAKHLDPCADSFTKTKHRVRDINNNILKAAGCLHFIGSNYTSSPNASMLACREELRQLARGFFIEQSVRHQRLHSVGIDGSNLPKSLLEDIYRLRLDLLNTSQDLEDKIPSLQILSDEMLVFTSSLWKNPLGGKTIVILSVTPPMEAIRCISVSSHGISNEDAIKIWWTFFRSSIEALNRYEVIFVQEHLPGSALDISILLQSIASHGDLLPSQQIEYNNNDKEMFEACRAHPDSVETVIDNAIIPQQMLDCYDALLTSDPALWRLCADDPL